MLESLLIANRGEIARRVIRTTRRLGIRSIAVFSEADANAPHVREADEAVNIGPAAAASSYLAADKILAAAKATGAAAIHPGYGFLSENPDFTEAVEAAGIIWVGPPPSAIRAMGLKHAAKRLMAEAGVPVTPGYLGENQDPRRLAKEAAAIGWPILIKAVAGGGGKGMRAVAGPELFADALKSAKREAAAAFGDDRVLLEKLVSRSRHIEVQVFGDRFGEVVHLFERDCSLQRRHQKVIEEAPAPGLDPRTREVLCAAAVRAAEAVNYQGAGTVEFIADASEGLRGDRIWFMEMNTRLQVEHPVTEAITGVDLVEWQLRVADGEALPLRQAAITATGHAVEARLYAEDPASGFLPSIGPLVRFRTPALGRVDSGYQEGGAVGPDYDPMIAKLISHQATRTGAISELERMCRGVQVWPVKANAAFLANCLAEPDFVAGQVDTGYIADRMPAVGQKPRPSDAGVVQALAGAGIRGGATGAGPWAAWGLRLNATPASSWRLYVDGEPRLVEVAEPAADGEIRTIDLYGEVILFENGATYRLSQHADLDGVSAAVSDGVVRAPMPGRIVQVSVKVGQRIAAGQTLVVLEAMKMEHALAAAYGGTVAAILCRVGDQVAEGATLARLGGDT